MVSGIRAGTRVLVLMFSDAVAVAKMNPLVLARSQHNPLTAADKNLGDPLMFLQDRDFCPVTRVTWTLLPNFEEIIICA